MTTATVAARTPTVELRREPDLRSIETCDPPTAARLLADWGFLANPDLPDGPGDARLIVALRPAPTFKHYDPETVEYWVARDGRGTRQQLTVASPMPRAQEFSWGRIRILDRLAVSNEWLTFGGDLVADHAGGMTVAVFSSPAPLLRRGGHSQGWDAGADTIGAFFGRLMIAVDYAPGFEQLVAAAPPLSRYAAFVADLVGRFHRAPILRLADQSLSALMDREAARLRADHPEAWVAGRSLLQASGMAPD